AMARGRRLVDLLEYVCLGPHAFVAPRVRHDAEAAEFVAAFDDRDVGLHRIVASRDPERPGNVVLGSEIEERDRPPAQTRRLIDEHREPPDRLGPDDDVGDAWRPLENRRAFLLRDASGDRDDRVVTLLGRELTELAEA